MNAGQGLRRVVLLVAAVICMLAGGCVTIRQHTKIERDGRCIDRMEMSLPAMMGTGMAEKVSDLKGQGYQVETKTEGERASFTLTKEFPSVASLFESIHTGSVKGGMGAREGKRRGVLEVRNLFFLTDYVFEETIEGSGSAPAGEATSESERKVEEAGRQMMKGLLTFTRTVEMPGSIVSHNGDRVQGSAVTWELTAESLEKSHSLKVSSRVVNVPAIAGAAILLLVLAALGGVQLLRTRRRAE